MSISFESNVEVEPLEIPRLAAFDASLGDVPAEELRRRRVAYLQDVILELQFSGQLLRTSGCVMLLWPFTRGVRRRAMEVVAEKFGAALEYWGLSREEVLLEKREGRPLPADELRGLLESSGGR